MRKGTSGNKWIPENVPWGRSLMLEIVCLVLALLLTACGKKADSEKETPSATAQPPAQSVASFSAAQKIGMFVYPKNNQSRDQQLIDESDCYNSAQQQTGIDPNAPAPSAPTAADMQVAQESAADQAGQGKGGRV